MSVVPQGSSPLTRTIFLGLLNRRKFLKYAGATAAVVGASALGLDYLNSPKPTIPSATSSSSTSSSMSTFSSSSYASTSTTARTTDLQIELFNDYHGDGQRQSDEPSITDLVLGVQGVDNNYSATLQADSEGKYWARNIPLGSYLVNAGKFRYVALSRAECRGIRDYPFAVTSADSSWHLALMEGFCTLPFATELHPSIFNYVDVGDVENPSDIVVRDWMGGHLTYKGHQGTDYRMEIGTRILVAAPGTVIGAEDDFQNNADLSTIGNRVVIDHGNGFRTAYNHLSRIAVEYRKFYSFVTPQSNFQKVKRGELIAYSGNTPHPNMEPHLHFETWPPGYYYGGLGRGNTIDPYRDLFCGKHGRALFSNSVSLWTKDNDPRYAMT